MPKVMPGYKAHARQRIVREAERIFSQKGYHRSTMTEIARSMGVSKASLYQYFGNKEDLLIAVLERMTEDRQIRMYGFLDDHDVRSIASGEFFGEFLRSAKASGMLGFDLIYEMSRNDSLRGMVCSEYEQGLDKIVSFLTKLKKRGILRKDVDSRAIATGIIGLRDGLLSMSTLGLDEKLLKRVWQNWMIMVLQSIMA